MCVCCGSSPWLLAANGCPRFIPDLFTIGLRLGFLLLGLMTIYAIYDAVSAKPSFYDPNKLRSGCFWGYCFWS